MTKLTKLRQLDLSIIERIKYENNGNRVAAHTRRNLLTIGRQYNRYLIAANLHPDPGSVSSFLEKLKEVQAPTTFNLSRQNLKKLLKHQPQINANYMMRVMVDELFTDIKPLRLEKQVLEYLKYPQVLQLILGSDPHTALIIEFLFKTGCRISEMISIRIKDIKVEKQVQIKLIGKGSKQRTVYIDHELYDRIREHFQGLFYLFENNRHHQFDRSNLFRKIKAAGLQTLGKDIHPHLLRHSTANYLLKDCGKSPKYVSEYLGHSDPAITLSMYIHEQPGEEVVDLFKVDTAHQTRKNCR